MPTSNAAKGKAKKKKVDISNIDAAAKGKAKEQKKGIPNIDAAEVLMHYVPVSILCYEKFLFYHFYKM